jgi:hypothetical protein
MKSSFNQPVKSALLKAALCGAVSLSAVSALAPWNIARGLEEEPHRGAPPKPIHQKPAPKPLDHPKALEHPKVAEKREAPEKREVAGKERIAPKARIHESPRMIGQRRIRAIRKLELVARLRHELFTHRWGFAYAEGLKHAPKSIRFLANGTVETEIKGERWYWEAMDERRVSLRTLADVRQPGIILEFNEGYTGFQYALPDKTIAVQGTPLEAIAEGPDSAPGGPASLEAALLNYPWRWVDGGKSYTNVHFEQNKSFHVADQTSFWNVTGPQTLHVQFENGDQRDLQFDKAFSVYSDGDQISGSRETEESTETAAESKP